LLLPHSPPRLRFAIAVAGLAAWLVPWGALHLQILPAPSVGDLAVVEPLGAAAALPPSLGLGYAFTVALGVGITLFVGDCVALIRQERRWRAASRCGEHLRALLPPELELVPAEIRVVAGSSVAAASGFLKPTVWIGDRYSGALLELTLMHEMWHVRGRDPLWLALIGAVRRAYWWNPLVAYLGRQAVLMLESSCDHHCATQVDKQAYIRELALLLLADASEAPRLIANARMASLDVKRLRLLGTPLRLRARDIALLGTIGSVGAATAAAAIVERAAPLQSYAPVELRAPSDVLPATPAGRVLATLVRAANGGDTELVSEMLNAYTPQEVARPLPLASGGARIVDVLRSEPLRIEYVVESLDTGVRYLGTIAVADPASATIAESRLVRQSPPNR
jgi:hypothetical protein